VIEFLTSLAHTGIGICKVGVEGNESLILGLFITGLVGSLTHCGGMCGPFVLSQCAARMEAIPLEHMTEMRRLAGAALLPYHLGRATTYGALGAAAALFGGILGGAGSFRLPAALMLILAAILLLAMALPGVKALGGAGGESRWARSVGRLAGPLFTRPFGLRGWALGVMLGFIPCGLLYAALAAAAAGGNPIAGTFGMLAFWAGTVPMLVLVAVVGQAALSHWRAPLLRAAPVLLVLNAGMLGFMAWQLLAS
jgi:sulfite exporter TauE/SafE